MPKRKRRDILLSARARATYGAIEKLLPMVATGIATRAGVADAVNLVNALRSAQAILSSAKRPRRG